MPFDDDLEEATPISRDPQRYRSERELERVRVTKNTRKNKRREREVSRLCLICGIFFIDLDRVNFMALKN